MRGVENILDRENINSLDRASEGRACAWGPPRSDRSSAVD